MPTISMFQGIIIQMFFDDHNPPHFHAKYQGNEALFDMNGEILEGELPEKQRRLIVAWVELHRDELIANWELAADNQPTFNIEPLR